MHTAKTQILPFFSLIEGYPFPSSRSSDAEEIKILVFGITRENKLIKWNRIKELLRWKQYERLPGYYTIKCTKRKKRKWNGKENKRERQVKKKRANKKKEEGK